MPNYFLIEISQSKLMTTIIRTCVILIVGAPWVGDGHFVLVPKNRAVVFINSLEKYAY